MPTLAVGMGFAEKFHNMPTASVGMAFINFKLTKQKVQNRIGRKSSAEFFSELQIDFLEAGWISTLKDNRITAFPSSLPLASRAEKG